MMEKFDPSQNYEQTKREIGYVPRKQATQKDYDRIGFMSGLEVHQQLLTEEKLFCRCPAGIYHDDNDYDAEVIRHMRPTLSELGEYDGTALMEFKTRKEIVYRINNETACTYEVDDTPPFKIDKNALEIALEISLLSKLNIVGEVHITRKQYLDGSIPTGFQRTAILGVEGEIPIKNKKIRLIQLSIEEDSCREISDIGHVRVYKTDRLGMPLIETVTYPDCVNPDEVREACNYIRFLNRSTDKVRVGIGAGRQDVNVSCKGGTRVEIKGVSHTKWIPELTHNECFRQWALLAVRDKLNAKIKNVKDWKINYKFIEPEEVITQYVPVVVAKELGHKFVVVNLPGFKGILSHFTQPEKMFANEISDRLKVIACLEKPNIIHSEDLNMEVDIEFAHSLNKLIDSKKDDAQILFWAAEEDIETALETIEERCQMAFDGVPNETRKSFEDGTTIFERVLPGADRMYPDTDSAPIPLDNDYIENLRKKLPVEVVDRYNQLKKWNIPEDAYTYLFRNNLVPLIEKIHDDLKIDPKFVGVFLAHKLKYIQGHYNTTDDFSFDIVYEMFKFIKEQKLELDIAREMMTVLYEHPKMDLDSVLTTLNFRRQEKNHFIEAVKFLKEKYQEIGKKKTEKAERDWIMGEIRNKAIGNISLRELSGNI